MADTPFSSFPRRLMEGLTQGRNPPDWMVHEMQQRLVRFVTVYPYSLAAMRGNIKYVDLRYRNGFAVGGVIAG